MKYIILYFFIFLTCFTLFGQIPQGINYQGIARDANGKELANQIISVEIEIIQNKSSLYSEKHNNINCNKFGLFNFIIGQGTQTSSLPFDSIPWENGAPKFIRTSIDFNNDGIPDLQGNTELLSVPYAFYALKSGSSSNTLTDGSIYLKKANQGIYLTSPNGSCFFITINDKGELQTEKKDCPKD